MAVIEVFFMITHLSLRARQASAFVRIEQAFRTLLSDTVLKDSLSEFHFRVNLST